MGDGVVNLRTCKSCVREWETLTWRLCGGGAGIGVSEDSHKVCAEMAGELPILED